MRLSSLNQFEKISIEVANGANEIPMKYKDANTPIQQRVEDLLSRLSFRQKIDQITCLVTICDGIPDFSSIIPEGIGHVGAFSVAENVDEISEYSREVQRYLVEKTEFGIPALIHCEAVSGGQFTGADVFPSAIAQASTWDPDRIYQMADLIREQMAAVGFRLALSPVLDIARDPRWGRVTETYGEDPTLTASIGTAFIKGIQGKDHQKGVAAAAKHFVGHGVTEGGLNMSRTMVSPIDLEEIHSKPFQSAITNADLLSVMNSYCSYNGSPVVCSRAVLTDLLRGRLGFRGVVVSDYIAADRIIDPFHLADTCEEAGSKALKAGLDVEFPRRKCFSYDLENEVREGHLDMADIDQAVRRVLSLKFELGLFENPYPDENLTKKVFATPAAKELNLKIARETITLLKNNNQILPLSKETKKIAVLGPHANLLRSYFSTFSYPAILDMITARNEDGQIFQEPGLIVYNVEQRFPGDLRESSPQLECKLKKSFPESKTLYEAIREYVPNCDVQWSLGVNYLGNNNSGIEEALNLAAQSDVVILTLGGKNGWGVVSTVGEGIDSTNIDLPGNQESFAKAVYALGKPCVVVHFDGRPLSNEYVASHFDAILEAWQPGQFAGQAIASILFGDCNPSGHLPVTAARNAGQLPVYYSMPRGSGYIGAGHSGMIVNPRGYINDTAFPLFHFGHGLSYTTFSYQSIALNSSSLHPDASLKIRVMIKNTGNFDGDEIIQLYFSDETASMVRPEIELAGFQRISLKTGETKTVEFTLQASQLAFLDNELRWKVEAGKYKIFAGSASNKLLLSDSFEVLSDLFIDGKNRGFYADSVIL